LSPLSQPYMSDQRGESNFNLGTSFDEELERQSRTTTTSRVEPASSDPLSFLLSGAEEESKKPRRIREFESIFDVSKLIEEKTHSSGTASSASAPSSLPSATAAGSAAATTTSSRGGGSSRPSLFLTGGNEEDFLKVIEQATKKAHANKRQHEHDDNEEEEEKAVDSLRPTPLEMLREFEALLAPMPSAGSIEAYEGAVISTSTEGGGGDHGATRWQSLSDTASGSLSTVSEEDEGSGSNATTSAPASSSGSGRVKEKEESGQEETEKKEGQDESMDQKADGVKEAEKTEGLDVPGLVQKALHRELVHTKIRGFCWKIFLGVLGSQPAEWRRQLEEHRAAFDILHKRHMIDPHAEGKELDPAINNPLSQAEESPWQQYFQDAELKKQIVLDTRRVYPENRFFKTKERQDMMLRILFIYAREHQDVLYKQGMHELLAPIIYVLEREALNEEDKNQLKNTEPAPSEDTVELLSVVNSSRYVEHDAYTLFDKLMAHTSSWFLSPARQESTQDFEATPFADPHAVDNSTTSPVVLKCKRIQQELLRRADPQLFQYLTDMTIEPQIYALRWVRLLLGREFHLEDVLRLWDAIFAYGQGLALVDYLIVAMLMFIRESLLGKDYTACLQRLFKYPPVEDVSGFITKALTLMNPKQPFKAFTDSSSIAGSTLEGEAATIVLNSLAPSSQTLASSSGGDSSSKNSNSNKKRAKTDRVNRHTLAITLKQLLPDSKSQPKSPNAPRKHEPPTAATLSKQLSDATKRVLELEQTQTHMAARLERIIFSLQTGFVENKLAEEERMEAVFLALAEIKQVKDILSGLLLDSDLLPPGENLHSVLGANGGETKEERTDK